MDNEPQKKTLIVVAGPTAVGKTGLAIQLARHYQTEIISADSRQFYREMSIGTAKPDEGELALAKHHFINSHSITDTFTVGDFERQSLTVLDDIFINHDVAILAGGSGLYIKAVCEGFDSLPPVDKAIRSRLNLALESLGITHLQEKLKAADPLYFQQADVHNPHRIIRALEVIESTGKTFSSFHTSTAKQRYFNIVKIGLNLPRAALYACINQRVDNMMAQGLVAEATSLLPYRNLNALNTVGYTELFDYIDGKTDLATATAMIKQNTRRFAKRQLTWFNKDKGIKWFEPDNLTEIIRYFEEQINP